LKKGHFAISAGKTRVRNSERLRKEVKIMKKILFVAMVLCFVASIGFAQEAAAPAATEGALVPAAAPAEETMTLTGVIIDNLCAGAHAADLAEFVKTHTKQCALMPDCEKSGYSLLVDGKLMKFDAASNAKVAEYLKVELSTLEAEIVAKKAGEEISVVSIKGKEVVVAPK
jgi:hypothetical protein